MPTLALEAHEFSYQVRWHTILFGLFSTLLLTGAFGYFAASNDRGLVVGHVLHFSTNSATLLYGFFCVLGVTTTALICRIIHVRFTTQQRLVLTKLALHMPHARWSTKTISLDYTQMKSLRLRELNGKRFLDVRSNQGATCTISSAMLASNAAFDQICQLLRAHGKHARI